MHHCPHCHAEVPTHTIDPRRTSRRIFCPTCDTMLEVNHKNELAATLHFTLFMLVTFVGTFFIGNWIITQWGASFALLSLPPLILFLLFMSYNRLNAELEKAPFVEVDEV